MYPQSVIFFHSALPKFWIILSNCELLWFIFNPQRGTTCSLTSILSFLASVMQITTNHIIKYFTQLSFYQHTHYELCSNILKRSNFRWKETKQFGELIIFTKSFIITTITITAVTHPVLYQDDSEHWQGMGTRLVWGTGKVRRMHVKKLSVRNWWVKGQWSN